MGRVSLRTSLTGIGLLGVILLITPIGAFSSDNSAPNIAFTPNHGQWDQSVVCRAEAKGAIMWFTDQAVYSQFVQADVYDPRLRHSETPDLAEVTTLTIRTRFPGADLNGEITFGEPVGPVRHYFTGSSHNNWHTNVVSYQSVVYHDVYEGIDLTYYGAGPHMEFDFVVQPGADYGQIALAFDGIESAAVDSDGHLVLRTLWGETRQLAPVVFQIENGERRAIQSSYHLTPRGDVTFQVNDYDRSEPLIIDPVLLYSELAGGAGMDYGLDVSLTADGKAIVAGLTQSGDFSPAVGLNEFQGARDGIVMSVDPVSNLIQWELFVGGTDYDQINGVALDNQGNIVVCGETRSADFPLQNPYQTYQGMTDAFVAKFTPDGDSLIHSTFLGTDIGHDDANDVRVDSMGRIVIAGRTGAAELFPVQNPLFTGQSGTNAFLSRFTVDGSQLDYSTTIGGTEDDRGMSLALDADGYIYLAGSSFSSDFPLLNPYATYYPDGRSDFFITKFAPDGDALIYSTYLGGERDDAMECIAVDDSGRAAVVGWTASALYPLLNPFNYSATFTDAVVSLLSAEGDALVFSSYIAGSAMATRVAFDVSGDIVIGGFAGVENFPLVSSIQEQRAEDAFVTRVRTNGTIVYSTVLGGGDTEFSYGLAIADDGSVIITGESRSDDFPATPGEPDHQGDFDIFVAHLAHDGDDCCVGARDDIDGSPGEATLGDLTALIDHLFISLASPLCWEEGNFDASLPDGPGSITLGDLTVLIDHLFVSLAPLPACP